ncbi:LOW QUALITY PROTEIN: redoxin, partial [Streptomyces viridosporus ATCC 14672]
MLMLAVAAGESGANPELSRNGVLVRARVIPRTRTGFSPRTCRQCARPSGPGALTSGPRGMGRWTRRRVRSCAAPCPRRGLRAERGRAPR